MGGEQSFSLWNWSVIYCGKKVMTAKRILIGMKWLMRCKVIGLLASVGLFYSCAPSVVMEDAYTLGRGNWKVELQAAQQHVVLYDERKDWFNNTSTIQDYLAGGYVSQFNAQLAVGLTDRLDVGGKFNINSTGVMAKYLLARSPSGFALALRGGIHSFEWALGTNYVQLRADMLYTMPLWKGSLTLQPGWQQFVIREDLSLVSFGFLSMGMHVGVPIDDHAILRIGLFGGRKLTPKDGTQASFLSLKSGFCFYF